MSIIEKIFGTHSSREVKRVLKIVDEINAYEDEIKALSDSELRGMTEKFKKRYSDGESLDDILPEAFAVVREAAWRVLGMRHFDVQLIGGIILHQGRIAEMKTGEGKTLVATAPVYLNAISGKGVHVVTVNDYLAKRDSEWMGKIYNFLGLTVGLIVHEKDNDERRVAYNADITYGTNNEFGFDYLRDNMVTYKEEMVQRPLNFAIVDEVDSILIDEARTPLIISGQGDKSTDMYKTVDAFAKRLQKKVFTETDDKQYEDTGDADYVVDEKASTCALTEKGIKHAEQTFNVENLSDPENMTLLHHINQAIRAHGIMKKDKDYVVRDGEVIIIDEFTGRMMEGRRYSDGLHQAIEAKENVKVERESKTLATITFQNYFRMYKKLSGMTGTALTEEPEFREIYGLDVVAIPTNKPVARQDMQDAVYQTEKAKLMAVVEEVINANKIGQPVLIGTITIEKSEELSGYLKRRGIKHEVLNAKNHAREAEIVAQAGKFGAVTIATNMAGRGTDIVLGGNPEFMAKQEMRKNGFSEFLINESTSHNDTTDEEVLNARRVYKEYYNKIKPITDEEKEKVVEAGGLYIIGTERHESRRIDNQLRGRSGRQGDNGKSKFYISLQDELMRLFGSDRMATMVARLGLEEDEAIEAGMLSGAIEGAQKKVEGRNFSIRKHVIQYDDVMNTQREIIYSQRKQVLDGEDMKEAILKMVKKVSSSLVAMYSGDSEYPDDWNWPGLNTAMKQTFGIKDAFVDKEQNLTYDKESLIDKVEELALEKYEQRENEISSEIMRDVERMVLLRCVDEKWMDHIDAMEQLKAGIGLRGYGQHDPVIEYKFEGFDMFEEMVSSIQKDVVALMYNLRVDVEDRNIERHQVVTEYEEGFAPEEGQEAEKPKTVVKGQKVGRNDPCPCGSGKKYKKCCGMNE